MYKRFIVYFFLTIATHQLMAKQAFKVEDDSTTYYYIDLLANKKSEVYKGNF